MANRVGIPIVGPRSDMDDPADVARPWPNETLAAALCCPGSTNESRSGKDRHTPAFPHFPFRMHSEPHFGRSLPKTKTPLTHLISGVFCGCGVGFELTTFRL